MSSAQRSLLDRQAAAEKASESHRPGAYHAPAVRRPFNQHHAWRRQACWSCGEFPTLTRGAPSGTGSRLSQIGLRWLGTESSRDSLLEGDGFELPVREHRATAPSQGFAAASHREAALRGAPASMADGVPRRRGVREARRRHAVHPSRNAVLRRRAGRPAIGPRGAPPCGPPIAKSGRAKSGRAKSGRAKT